MVDIVVIILILLGAFVGFKRGFTRELVSCVGFILCVILAYLLKNPISNFMYDHLPFFTFGGVIKGVVVFNILLYEVISFFLTLSILLIILKIVTAGTKVFEGFLNATIVLGIPSKILGFILGAIEWVIICFIGLLVLSLPIFKTNYLYESKIGMAILNNTPILSNVSDNTLKVYKEFENLKDKYEDNTNVNQFNLDALDLFLKYHIVDISSVEKLYNNGKLLSVNNISSVLDNYR